MPTLAEVHAALDSATNTAFSGYTVFYKNQTAPKQTSDFIKQLVFFSDNKQFELGNTARGRQRGKIVFVFHIRKGTGSAVLNTWHQIVLNVFRTKVIGGAVLLDALSSTSAETENWSITVVEVPFYFDN